MTDPTPQAEQDVCKWCLRTIVPPTNEMPYWSEPIRFLGWHCLSQEGPGKHEPAEPSPAPPAEREWLVVDSMPEAMKILADKLKQAESALTAAREERDQYKESFNLECDRREGCLDQLTAMREERDRAQAALRDMLVIAEFDRWHCASTGRQIAFRKAEEALKPVSDRQPEGDTK